MRAQSSALAWKLPKCPGFTSIHCGCQNADQTVQAARMPLRQMTWCLDKSNALTLSLKKILDRYKTVAQLSCSGSMYEPHWIITTWYNSRPINVRIQKTRDVFSTGPVLTGLAGLGVSRRSFPAAAWVYFIVKKSLVFEKILIKSPVLTWSQFPFVWPPGSSVLHFQNSSSVSHDSARHQTLRNRPAS